MNFTIPASLQLEHEALRGAAERAGQAEIVAFAQDLAAHARTEDEVMYPAALLVGQLVRLRLASHISAA